MYNRLPIIGQQDNKPQSPNKKVSVDHRRVLNQMLKTIIDTKMDDELKMILRMRIWGKHPQAFQPMSCKVIAKDLKTKVKNVEAWEEEALHYIKQHLERVSMFDITGRANESWFTRFKLFVKGKLITT